MDWYGRHGYVAGASAALLAGLLLLAAALFGGCGGEASEAQARPFGAPPSPAPGVRAWAAGEVGTLLVTADGGATWKRQRFYLSERGVDVAFPDAETGWLATDAGAVLLTVDGGGGWKVVEKASVQIKALAATDALHAWVVATTVPAAGGAGTAVVLRTDNGGATWARTGFGDAMLADVAFADARSGVLVALDRIWTTRDGGRSWKLRRRLGLTVLTSAFAGDARHAWVAGWDTQDGLPVVVTTQDGGVSWRRLDVDVPAPPSGDLQAKQIVAAGDLTGGAHLWLTCNAGVLASTDGGRTWVLQQVPAGQPQAVGAADARHLIATTTGQPVLATADGGQTWLAFGRDGFLRRPLVAVAAVATPVGE